MPSLGSEPDSSGPDDQSAEVRATLQANQSRSRIVWLALLVLAAAGVAGGIWWWSGEEPQPDYQTTTADRGDIVMTATTTGSLEPKREVTVGAEVSGQIEEVLVEQNDRVEKGQKLARLDTTALENSLAQSRAELGQARASLAEAEASLEEAKLDEQRTERLFEEGSSSRQALEQARASRARAEAQVQSARARVQQASAAVSVQKTDLEKATIVSPVDGVVLSRSVEPGNTIAASFETPELFVLAEDLTDMQLHVSVDEADVSLVEQGQSATFTVDAWPDRSFDATVQLVALQPTVDNNVVTYKTELDVENTDRDLRPGMTATATIQTGRREDVVRVPNAALRFVPPPSNEQGGMRFGPPRDDRRSEPDEDTVYRLVDGEPQKVHIQTGRSDGRHTEILTDNIEPGDVLVTGIGRRRSNAGRSPAGSADDDSADDDSTDGDSTDDSADDSTDEPEDSS